MPSAALQPCRTIALGLVCLLQLLAGCQTTALAAAQPRPLGWASKVAAIPGLPNLYRVDSTLYRSAQPTRDGFARLAAASSLADGDQPIRTVVSLRAVGSDASRAPASSTLRLEQIRFHTWHPEDEDVVTFMRIVTTPALQPVLVHCRHGSDRTGAMIAVYRIAYGGWTKAQAIDEMIHGGFGFHPMWQNLRRYIDALDVDAIKAQVAQQGNWP